MPRLQRRVRLKASALSDDQEGVLRFGPMLREGFFGKPFATQAEELECWRKHRAMLMENCEPGVRPYAFFKLELKAEPKRAWDMVEALFAARLIDPTEAAGIELIHPILGPHGRHGAAVKENLEFAGRLQFAGQWHAWRGRPELAAVYQARAGRCVAAIKDSTKRKAD